MICATCKLNKLEEDFYKTKVGPRFHCYSCKPCWNAYQLSRPKKKAYSLKHYYKKRDYYLNKAQNRWRELKFEVMYRLCGNSNPICQCCCEDSIEFLSIDHINNNGAKQRREDKSSAKICRWLKKNNYPKGYQVLCFNCNMAKALYGSCPHHKEAINAGI